MGQHPSAVCSLTEILTLLLFRKSASKITSGRAVCDHIDVVCQFVDENNNSTISVFEPQATSSRHSLLLRENFRVTTMSANSCGFASCEQTLTSPEVCRKNWSDARGTTGLFCMPIIGNNLCPDFDENFRRCCRLM